MEHLAEVLHELVDAARHVLSPNRVGELHDLADKVDAGARAVAEMTGVVKDAEPPAKTGPKAPADGAAGA